MTRLLPMVALSVLALLITVPVVGSVIRHIEPGRDKAPELQNLSNQDMAMPETGPFVLAHCAEPCRLGSWVKLYAGRIDKPGYLAVWAESEGERIWYYPSESGFFPEVHARADIQVLSDGLKLSKAHASHPSWTLKLVLVDARYGRSEVLALPPEHVLSSRDVTLGLGSGGRER